MYRLSIYWSVWKLDTNLPPKFPFHCLPRVPEVRHQTHCTDWKEYRRWDKNNEKKTAGDPSFFRKVQTTGRRVSCDTLVPATANRYVLVYVSCVLFSKISWVGANKMQPQVWHEEAYFRNKHPYIIRKPTLLLPNENMPTDPRQYISPGPVILKQQTYFRST